VKPIGGEQEAGYRKDSDFANGLLNGAAAFTMHKARMLLMEIDG
jgi:hypothetical protein